MKELSREPCKELSSHPPSQPRKQLSRQSLRYRYINPFFMSESVDPKSTCKLYPLMVFFTVVYYIVLCTIFTFPSVICDFAFNIMYNENFVDINIFPVFIQMMLLPGMIISAGITGLGTIAGCMFVVVFGAIFILDGIYKGVTFVHDNYPDTKINLEPIREFFSKIFSRICTDIDVVD